MNIDKMFESKNFKRFFIGMVIAIAILLIFEAGESVGFHKARFSYRWAENYQQNFGGGMMGRGGMMGIAGGFSGRDYINTHGIFGPIIKIDGNTIIIKDKDNTEKTITVSSKTTIRKGMQNAAINDLKVDDNITVIGSPNDQGQIEAKFIRLFNY